MTVGPQKGSFLADLIATHKPSTVIELGGFVGYSAILLGDALRRSGGKKYHSLEFDPVNAAVANLLIDLAGLRDTVTIHVAPSHETLAQFVRDGIVDHIEFMLIDHWKDRYVPDMWLMENLGLFKAGVTVLAADNCITPGAPDFLEWVRASHEKREELLQTKYGFDSYKNYLTRDALVKAIKEGKDDLELENIPGDPSWVYETEMAEFKFEHRHVSLQCHNTWLYELTWSV